MRHKAIALLTALVFLVVTSCATIPEENKGAATGAGVGAATGAVLGAVVGRNVSGAVIGGLVGALSGMGIPESEARQLESGLRAGGVLVTVQAGYRARVSRAGRRTMVGTAK